MILEMRLIMEGILKKSLHPQTSPSFCSPVDPLGLLKLLQFNLSLSSIKPFIYHPPSTYLPKQYPLLFLPQKPRNFTISNFFRYPRFDTFNCIGCQVRNCPVYLFFLSFYFTVGVSSTSLKKPCIMHYYNALSVSVSDFYHS